MSSSERLAGYDVIRGLAVISMVGFHFCYDLVYLEGIGPAWFKPPLQTVWRCSISWTFLLLAGIMCTHSRSNLKRAGRYLALAAAIWVVTYIVAVDTPISFGIIYCMGASTLAAWALGVVGLVPRSAGSCLVFSGVLVVLFLLCLGIGTGTFGLGFFGGPCVALPHALYATDWLSWLGFPGPRFASGDYYPPLPYTLLFLAAACVGRYFSLRSTPTWICRLTCAPLEWVGRHALGIYVVHQPVLLAASMLLAGL